MNSSNIRSVGWVFDTERAPNLIRPDALYTCLLDRIYKLDKPEIRISFDTKLNVTETNSIHSGIEKTHS